VSPRERYTGTLYVVRDGAVALHRHGRLGTLLPPGGHVEAGEAPHEAALRETREETGLEVSLSTAGGGVSTAAADPLPAPRHVQRIDLAALPGDLEHTIVDFVYYARAGGRGFDPEPGEVPADRWAWYGPEDLRDEREALTDDVFEYARDAVASVR
jgi:ADP-ribose pyrophosphatase YjhB (NUDIX family)